MVTLLDIRANSNQMLNKTNVVSINSDSNHFVQSYVIKMKILYSYILSRLLPSTMNNILVIA